jgi:hypothetical protein
VALGEALGCNILERHFINYSFFINSKKGTRILIFWISFSKMNEDEDFGIILDLVVGFLTRTWGL